MRRSSGFPFPITALLLSFYELFKKTPNAYFAFHGKRKSVTLAFPFNDYIQARG
jgi:hypothetical protein